MRLPSQKGDEQGKPRKPGKKSALGDVHERAKAVDLWVEFHHQCDVIMKEFEAKKNSMDALVTTR